MVRSVILFAAMFSTLLLTSCESRETLAEVDFENAKFGLEYIPDRSLEGYNEKYHPFFTPAGSTTRKYLLNPGDGFMFSFFPKDPELLKSIDVVIVDTMARSYEKYDRTVALTTLYIDPKVIDRSSWETFSRFVNKNYSQPDADNDLIKWMNYKYNLGDHRDSLHVLETIYALVYSDVETLESVYVSSDGKRSVKVGVDNGIYFKDDSEKSPGWLYTGRLQDSVFYYWQGRAELVPEFERYKMKEKEFKSLFREVKGEE